MQINLNQLRCFYTVARHGSMQAAAEKLFVSPSAVTMQLKKLEEALEMRLLIRQRGRIGLSQQGQELYTHAAKIFELVENLESILTKQADSKADIRVGIHHVPAQYVMPALLAHWRRTCPTLRIRLILGTQAESLRRLRQGETDLAFVAEAGAVPECRIVPFFREELSLVAAPSSMHIRGSCISVKQLNGIPFFLQQQGTGLLSAITAYFDRYGIRPQVLMQDISGDIIKQFVARDEGLAFLAGYTIQREVADGVLRVVDIAEGGPGMQLNMLALAGVQNPQIELALSSLASFSLPPVSLG
ncbi:MAG: LysR family transcriptional regulator [Desulfobulbaceae bacterium]|nr:LysR family transcriptional regulator [Desulfobulbaceae bacterium]